jgi:hypothetical protein
MIGFQGFKINPDMQRKRLSPADPGIAARLAALDKQFGIQFHEQRQPIVETCRLKG